MNTYVKIEKQDEYGETISVGIEPLSIQHIGVALEEALIEEGEVGQSVVLTLVEMSAEAYKEYERENGY